MGDYYELFVELWIMTDEKKTGDRRMRRKEQNEPTEPSATAS